MSKVESIQERKDIASKIHHCKQCSICGQSFETIWPKTKYCSKECKKIAVKAEQKRKFFKKKAKNESDPKLKERCLRQYIDPSLAFCEECDIEFKLEPNQVSKFCCEECRQEARRRSARICQKQRRLNTPKIKKTSTSVSQYKVSHNRNCEICDVEFTTTGRDGQGGGKYCSDECKTEAKRLRYLANKKEDLISQKIIRLEMEKDKLDTKDIDPYFLKRGDTAKNIKVTSMLSMGA